MRYPGASTKYRKNELEDRRTPKMEPMRMVQERCLHNVPCQICGTQDSRRFSTQGRNRVVICRHCGLFYVSPIPAEDVLAQRLEDSNVYTQDQLEKQAFFKRRAVRLFEKVEQIMAPGRVLDIGCAIGTELAVARERGWSGIGVELSRSSVRIAREKGLNVHACTLEDSGFPDSSFDLVTGNHVLEHIPIVDPFFRELKRVLRRGGFLFLSLPNVNSWKRFLRGGRDWTFNDEHFVHYGTKTLTRILERYDFRIIDISTSRSCDFHDDLANHSFLFRGFNKLIEKMALGIEIFSLSQSL